MPPFPNQPPVCNHPMTQKGMEARVAEMVFEWSAGRVAKVLHWLKAIGCKVNVIERGGDGEPTSWAADGLTGVRCGLIAGLSPLDTFPQFGMILMGPFWPHVIPGLPKLVDRMLKERSLVKRAKEKPAPTEWQAHLFGDPRKD